MRSTRIYLRQIAPTCDHLRGLLTEERREEIKHPQYAAYLRRANPTEKRREPEHVMIFGSFWQTQRRRRGIQFVMPDFEQKAHSSGPAVYLLERRERKNILQHTRRCGMAQQKETSCEQNIGISNHVLKDPERSSHDIIKWYTSS